MEKYEQAANQAEEYLKYSSNVFKQLREQQVLNVNIEASLRQVKEDLEQSEELLKQALNEELFNDFKTRIILLTITSEIFGFKSQLLIINNCHFNNCHKSHFVLRKLPSNIIAISSFKKNHS